MLVRALRSDVAMPRTWLAMSISFIAVAPKWFCPFTSWLPQCSRYARTLLVHRTEVFTTCDVCQPHHSCRIALGLSVYIVSAALSEVVAPCIVDLSDYCPPHQACYARLFHWSG